MPDMTNSSNLFVCGTSSYSPKKYILYVSIGFGVKKYAIRISACGGVFQHIRIE